MGREEDRHDRGDPAPVVGPTRDLLSRQPLAEADQVRMIRQAKALDHRGGIAGGQGRHDHVPAHADDAKRAGDGDGPQGGASPQREDENGHCDVAGDGQRDRQGRSAVLAPSELDSALDGIDDERRAEQQRQCSLGQRGGADHEQPHQKGQAGARIGRPLDVFTNAPKGVQDLEQARDHQQRTDEP